MLYADQWIFLFLRKPHVALFWGQTFFMVYHPMNFYPCSYKQPCIHVPVRKPDPAKRLPKLELNEVITLDFPWRYLFTSPQENSSTLCQQISWTKSTAYFLCFLRLGNKENVGACKRGNLLKVRSGQCRDYKIWTLWKLAHLLSSRHLESSCPTSSLLIQV